MSARKSFTKRLFDALWADYAERVPYARVYQNMLAELGGVFISDHVAFRSLAVTVNGQDLGIMAIHPVFAALGFEEKGQLDFPAQKLYARYLQHEEPDFPKIFISELRVDELDEESRRLIRETVGEARLPLSVEDLQALRHLDTSPEPPDLFGKVVSHFRQVPWLPPTEHAVRTVNTASQYGAWVLLHGYNVNHFTGYVNRHGVEGIDDIDGLVEELRKRGVPMMEQIEGARGTRLRQISTQPVRVPVRVRDAEGAEKEIEWTYAYMEYAQRGEVQENGAPRLFQGFLGPHASHFFEMTRMK